jgi:2',3'-cyclic-nucleotide 2'-phosphodiesterase (5'-nucleotidase family)
MTIGIFGVTAPRIAEYAQTVALDVKDPIIVAKQIVAELEPKCNFIIALTHIGYDLDLQLAREIPSIDAIIGGDSHTWLPNPVPVKALNPVGPEWWVGGPIVCQDGEWGKCLGRLELAVRKDPSGQYLVTRYQAKLINIDASIKPAGDVENIIKNVMLKN